MGTMLTDTELTPVTARRGAGRPVLAVVTVMAVIGAIIAAWTVVAHREKTLPTVGDPVDTTFGSFRVTAVSKTFVPDTQGPPTPAQHVGANGSDQLQVWVSLANTKADRSVRYSPDEFSLISEKAAGGAQKITGSTLRPGQLQPGGSIDGQVWFDAGKALKGRRWLLYRPSEGPAVRVSLGTVDLTKVNEDDNHGDGAHHH